MRFMKTYISNVYEKEVLIINNLYKEKTNKTTHHWAFFLFIEFFKKSGYFEGRKRSNCN